MICNGKGVFLTWEDLSVSVSSSRDGPKQILKGLTGYACSGDVLAVMGPSGCGKSTLLDALAGRLSSTWIQNGDILLNGHKQQLAYGTSAYVTQEDTLTWTLTVKEAVHYSAQLQLPNSMSKAAKAERVETTIREMGLQDSVDTRIGGWGRKGLSNGQKRRLSICLEILTRPKLLFLDEPTSGLDSAASYYVMSRIAKVSKQEGMTVVASIHQPSCDVFGLFRNLCLLSSGRTIYFGNCSAATEFFATNGFPCPSLQNPADHYLKTINSDFDEDIEQGNGAKATAEEAIDVLVESYRSSSNICKLIEQQLANIHTRGTGAIVEKKKKKGGQASFFFQCLALTERSFINMSRDMGYYWLRLAIYIALAFGLGTVFFDIGTSYGSIQARGSVLMFIASFLTILAIGGFPSFVEDMKVFERERLNGHYGSLAFVVGNTLSSMPYLFAISLIPGGITYYLIGLHGGNKRFIHFAMTLFACMMLVESLMMIVASLVPNFLMGVISGAGIQGLMMLSGGFFRLPKDLPNVFWRYPMYYISFHKYAFQGLYKNEFEGMRFGDKKETGIDSYVEGDKILRETFDVEMGYSKWVDLGILFGMIVLYKFLFFGFVKGNEQIKPFIKGLLKFLSFRNTN
ncbi:ABC transporter G family member 1-like isoform X2 [Impatiens glandulifera]|nr:ABC transporter G family member 1-like isoform X2 [Impatiens glandulifera]XP_047321796.1 ABC transporter G family member 1-like isoform X2 [Impatiens glandulifera]